MAQQLSLGYGFGFEDLYARDGLVRLDRSFCDYLDTADPALFAQLMAARAAPDEVARKAESELVIAAGPHLEDYLGTLFGIRNELAALRASHDALAPLYTVKRLFVQRRAAKGVSEADAAAIDGPAIGSALETVFGEKLTESVFARHVETWLRDEAAHADVLTQARLYASWATISPAGKALHGAGILFKLPHKTDPMHLVPVETIEREGVTMLRLPPSRWRHREGFALTDKGMDPAGALDHANYCIWCHNQGKDSCSKGIREKDNSFRPSAFGVPLNGCPLDEKISEMNLLKAEGHPLAALATVIIDNPMTAGTGHRICNDCMKSCIYQKQEPVDIPQIETRTLKDILALPWGFEIYALLTRWNPLNIRRPVPRPASGYKVLVVGLGPSGYTLSHHLMNDGHAVVAIDGLKIEPLDETISGVTPFGVPVPFQPIRDVASLQEPLEDRAMAGFGGVAEYGITVRWDKNYLKLIRLLLERRRQFTMVGGVRFGGTLTIDEAFAMGFDHVALCAGAGRPTVIPMKNGLATGVRQASDFLMALQLTGAAKANAIANLQLRLPVVVIGGGLTAIDTATELLAYYPVQVEKFLSRYDEMVAARGEAAVRASWSPADIEAAIEFLQHAKALRSERAAALAEGRTPRIAAMLDEWGGVTLAYRRHLTDAPSYTLNHEEVALGMQEGIRFAPGLSPVAVEIDDWGQAERLKLKSADSGEIVTLGARSILVAAGTQPNTVLNREDPTHLLLDGKYFQAYDEAGEKVHPARSTKPDVVQVLVSGAEEGPSVSYFGDLHPSYAGNVVKAMASAKQGYPVISRILARRAPSKVAAEALAAEINRGLRAFVHQVNRLTPTIVEVVVRAPYAARGFLPGQFYRLQNFERFAPRTESTLLAMEGLALTGASVDRENGLLSTIVLEMGGSSDLCAFLKPGEPVILMGPTGTPTETPPGETVLLAGGGLGNAVLFSIGQALRASGSRVLLFAAYKKIDDRYKLEEIEAAADTVVWCCDEAPGFIPGRAGDRAFVGNIVQAMRAYGAGELGAQTIALKEVDRIVAIGSDRMMQAVAAARHGVLQPYLNPHHEAIGSINSPMQCMMKEICAQCLQLHRDPETGAETVVFSCFNQDQKLDHVDFGNLRQRLALNGVQEKLTRVWIDHSLRELGWRVPSLAAE